MATNETASGLHPRLREALWAIREKDILSTTLERLRLTREADALVQGLPQPLQLGEGLYHLLDRISVSVSPNDVLVGRIAEEVPDATGEAFFQETVKGWKGRGIPLWMPDSGHECFAWERVLKLGLPGLEDFASRERTRRAEAGESQATLDWLSGAVRLYQALRRYARRYAQAAAEQGLEAAAWCAAIAERPPQTFAEALQLVWLITHVYCTMLARNPTLTMGRADEMLLRFHRADIAAGRLTRERAADLVDDFYAKNTLILGRGEHQMDGGSGKATGWERNLAYDAPQYLLLGGRRRDGSPSANELTELFLERIVPALENPVIVLRYTPDMPERLWRLACDKLRQNASMLVYNDESVITAFVHAGVSEPEAVDYSLYGCNWPVTYGTSRSVIIHRLLLPRHFLQALLAADRPPTSAEALYERFAASVRAEVEGVCANFRRWRTECDAKAPGLLRMDDCFLDGPVARARSWALGGTPLSTVIVGITGLGTTADSFAAVDELAFRSSAVGLDELCEALRQDWAGQETLRQRCVRAAKFGRGDDHADGHAARMLTAVLDEMDRARGRGTPEPICVLPSLTTDMTQRSFGAQLGATPDGRRKGQPISENMSPSPGAATEGLTSLFRSLAKLPFKRVCSGPLNVRITPKLVKGEAGLANLAAALRTYFAAGGLQVQLSFVSADELRAAQAHPEAYRDLMVRITGYSAVFVDMSRPAQEEIIARTEMMV